MNAFNIDLNGIKLTKNLDGTYYGTKETELLDECSGDKHRAILEYPRINIKWKSDVEYSEIISFEILKDIDTNKIWSMNL